MRILNLLPQLNGVNEISILLKSQFLVLLFIFYDCVGFSPDHGE